MKPSFGKLKRFPCMPKPVYHIEQIAKSLMVGRETSIRTIRFFRFLICLTFVNMKPGLEKLRQNCLIFFLFVTLIPLIWGIFQTHVCTQCNFFLYFGNVLEKLYLNTITTFEK